MPAERKTPGCFSSARKGGRGGAEPDPHTCRSRNPPLEDPPQFFGQIFWEKILEIKILASSRPTPQPLLLRPPASLRIYSARGSARHASLPCQPSITVVGAGPHCSQAPTF